MSDDALVADRSSDSDSDDLFRCSEGGASVRVLSSRNGFAAAVSVCARAVGLLTDDDDEDDDDEDDDGATTGLGIVIIRGCA